MSPSPVSPSGSQRGHQRPRSCIPPRLHDPPGEGCAAAGLEEEQSDDGHCWSNRRKEAATEHKHEAEEDEPHESHNVPAKEEDARSADREGVLEEVADSGSHQSTGGSERNGALRPAARLGKFTRSVSTATATSVHLQASKRFDFMSVGSRRGPRDGPTGVPKGTQGSASTRAHARARKGTR
jgi:hypothetical protein